MATSPFRSRPASRIGALLSLLLVVTMVALPSEAGVETFGFPSLVDDHRRVGLLCAFADRPQRDYDAAFIQALYDDPDVGAVAYVRENSYGAADISGSRAHGWYTLPGDREDYIAETSPGVAGIYNFAGFVQDCVDAASSDPAIDWETVEGVDVWHNDGTDLGWNGGIEEDIDTPAGTRRLRATWMYPSGLTQQTFLHEMGHSFSGAHSGGPDVPGGSVLGFDGSHWDGLAGTACRLVDPDFGCVAPH